MTVAHHSHHNYLRGKANKKVNATNCDSITYLFFTIEGQTFIMQSNELENKYLSNEPVSLNTANFHDPKPETK